MNDNTAIEWTDVTWNPTLGCTPVSEGCGNCYAARQAARHSGEGRAYEGLVKSTRSGPRWTGEIQLMPEALSSPAHWRKPRRIFVDSMSDLFHEDVPLDYIKQVFATMRDAKQHQFQVLTKRSARLAKLAPHLDWASNIWMGVSVELAKYTSRIQDLCTVPAAVRFLSLEPLLGPIDSLPLDGIHWVIVGGESGPGSTMHVMKPEWVRSIRDQCVARSVPFFFKQWGGVFKKKYGRELDGRTWDEYPVQKSAR